MNLVTLDNTLIICIFIENRWLVWDTDLNIAHARIIVFKFVTVRVSYINVKVTFDSIRIPGNNILVDVKSIF